jgi:hypothetical protein
MAGSCSRPHPRISGAGRRAARAGEKSSPLPGPSFFLLGFRRPHPSPIASPSSSSDARRTVAAGFQPAKRTEGPQGVECCGLCCLSSLRCAASPGGALRRRRIQLSPPSTFADRHRIDFLRLSQSCSRGFPAREADRRSAGGGRLWPLLLVILSAACARRISFCRCRQTLLRAPTDQKEILRSAEDASSG